MSVQNQPNRLLKQPEQFLGVPCLIAGADTVRVQECADTLRAAAREQGYLQVERVDATERNFDWDELRAVCVSPGLFASRRILDLRLSQAKLGAAAAAVLTECLETTDPDLQWIISLGEWSRKAEQEKWVKAVAESGNVIGMWPLKPNELAEWVRGQAGKRRLTLDKDAVSLLLWRTEGNLLATVMELEKLALAHPESHWNAAELGDYVGDSARFDVFALVDEAIYGNALRMRRVLRALKGEGEAPARIVPWIARQLQLMFELADCLRRGQNPDQLLRTRQVFAQRASQYQRAAARHSPAQWRQLWIELGLLDRLSKGRERGSPWVALERLLLRVALANDDGRRFAG